MTQQTLFLIKPDAVAHGHVGQIIAMIEAQGFHIVAIRKFSFTPELAATFYAEHIGKEFYTRLVNFMCSGDTIGMILEKENAIPDLRELIGDVEPAKRKPHTIRALYGEGVTENAVHASDCPASAAREIPIIFPDGR
jgi:nucleoside-diphosphate kinase